jgi:hypothetical protein
MIDRYFHDCPIDFMAWWAWMDRPQRGRVERIAWRYSGWVTLENLPTKSFRTKYAEMNEQIAHDWAALMSKRRPTP